MNSENYKDIISELRHEYLVSFLDKFNNLRELHAAKDWSSIELEFHKLKGTGATYGAPEVTELCQVVESHCRQKTEISLETLEKAIQLLQGIRDKYLNNKDFDLAEQVAFTELKNL